jgi:hypothetical protein
LLKALGAVKPDQYDPLGARDPELRRLMIGVGPQHARYVIDTEAEFSVEGKRQQGLISGQSAKRLFQ